MTAVAANTRREPIVPAESRLSFMRPARTMTGPAMADLTGEEVVDPDKRQAAIAADLAAMAAMEAQQAAEAARLGEQGAAALVEERRKQAARTLDQVTGRARAADAKARSVHAEWIRAYQAARAAGVSAAVLQGMVDRRNTARPAYDQVVAPE